MRYSYAALITIAVLGLGLVAIVALPESYLRIIVAIVLLASLPFAYLAYRLLARLEVAQEELREVIDQYAQGNLTYRFSSERARILGSLVISLRRMARYLSRMIQEIARHAREQDAVFLSLREGILVVDSNERVLKLNEAACKMGGITSIDGEGKPVEEIIKDQDLLQLIREAMVTKTPCEGEVLLMGDKETLLKVYARPLEGETESDLLVVLNDITQIRRLETMRRDFVANVSHELKTPITSIRGSVEILLDGAMDNPEDAHKFVSMIGRQAERLDLIFDDLLSLSRIEQDAEQNRIGKESHKVVLLLQSVVDLCAYKAEEKGLELSLACNPEVEAMVNGSLLQQAVMNLVDNAVKFSQPGKKVELSALSNGDDLFITVTDEGPGIPAAHLPRLFERFYRVDSGRGRKEGGTGLGLAIVKHICQVHGGGVSVKSELGKGTSFVIRIPAT